MDEDDAVNKVMKDFDTSSDTHVDFQEFVNGIGKWLDEARSSKVDSLEAGPETFKYLTHFHEVCGYFIITTLELSVLLKLRFF